MWKLKWKTQNARAAEGGRIKRKIEERG